MRDRFTVNAGTPVGIPEKIDGTFTRARTTFYASEASECSYSKRAECPEALFDALWKYQHGVDSGSDCAIDEVEAGLRLDPAERDKRLAINALMEPLVDAEQQRAKQLLQELDRRDKISDFNSQYRGIYGAVLAAMIVALYEDVASFETGEEVCKKVDDYIKDTCHSLDVPRCSNGSDPTKLASYAFRKLG
jgi:hypothetical protein